MAHFEIQNLTFSYPNSEKKALNDINLRIEKGEYVLLCGKSGSGKSTLLRHLKSVLAPYGKHSGSVLFSGKELSDLDAKQQACSIGFVMQNPDEQIVTDKVWHELAFGLESIGCDTKTMCLRVGEMASYFGILPWFHRDVTELSGGQKQLLNLASVMAMQPEVLILDEPTAQLDPLAASDFLATVRKINRDFGTTVILTEHRLEEVYPAADRIIVMQNGRIISQGDPRSIGSITKDDLMLPTPLRIFYGVGAVGSAPVTVREGRKWLTGLLKTPKYTKLDRPEQKFGTPALVLKNVWFRYEKDTPDILRGLDLSVPKGSLFAIVGSNGAGKSTTLKTICSVCKPYRGSVEVLGKPLKKYKDKELFNGGLTMLPQDPASLFSKSSVQAELEEMSRDPERIRQIAELCEVSTLLGANPMDLSGGEQQRVALSKVLLTQPQLLLLDEPTKGLDGFFKEKLANLLRTLAEEGISVVIVSHDVEFCAQYADLVSMFFDGQILSTQPPHLFFSANSFYTTAASRMSRGLLKEAVTAEDVITLCRMNLEGV